MNDFVSEQCPWLFSYFHGKSWSPPTQASPAETFCSSALTTHTHTDTQTFTHRHTHTHAGMYTQTGRKKHSGEERNEDNQNVTLEQSISAFHLMI